MILIGLGSNLSSDVGFPAQVLNAAKLALIKAGVQVLQSSRLWKSAPVPFDPTQPWFCNAVMAVETTLSPQELLKVMLEIETDFGRVRGKKNASRVLDLDLIAYHDEVIEEGDTLIVPHPRMHERLFVLKPLADVSKVWIHPISGHALVEMIKNVPEGQEIRPMEEGII